MSTRDLNMELEPRFESSCISNILQIIVNVQHDVGIINQQLSQIIKESKSSVF
jgi:hypothetical protein